MIHQFFGLSEQPFGVTPDPRYLYLAQGHREALASLFYGIESNRGFLALIAKPGMGKTTLLFHLLEKFRYSARTAFIFQTQCHSRDLLRFLLAELGIASQDDDLVRMHEQFNRYLLEESSAGHRVIVVIDEAQNLEPSVMETVRLLSNFETPRGKLLQIILAGQPELATTLSRSSLSQLRQRISSFNGLDPLAPQDVAHFIDHRLQVARYQGPPLFSDKAKIMIANLSEGIPRNINSLCFGALSLACALHRRTIDADVVREVFADLDLQKLIPHAKNPAVSHVATSPSHLVSPPPSPLVSPPPSHLVNPPPSHLVNPPPSHLADPRIASLSLRKLDPPGRTPARSSLSEATLKPAAVAPPQGVANVLDRISNDDKNDEVAAASANSQEPTPISRKSQYSLLSRVVGLAVLLCMVGGWPKRVTAPVLAFANLSSLANSQSISPPSNVKIPHAEVIEVVPAKIQPNSIQDSTDDPAELWNRVKEGSTSAEIKLAALYMEGSGVDQDCEQAHLLLLAASRKGSKVASGLLGGKYAEQCQ
jgi:type II secretory pathway predicted ATPase ExeA